jgi:hypothetical protein
MLINRPASPFSICSVPNCEQFCAVVRSAPNPCKSWNEVHVEAVDIKIGTFVFESGFRDRTFRGVPF